MSLSVREFGRGLGEKRPEGIAPALKVSNPSLGYLASYARIAIHIGDFSPQTRKMAHRTRNKIAQAGVAALRELPAIVTSLCQPQDPDPRVEES
jgi:hypothetical protein